MQYASYCGDVGSKLKTKQTLSNNCISFESKPLKAYQGLTVAAMFPAGSAVSPSVLQRLKWHFQDTYLAAQSLPWEDLPCFIALAIVSIFCVIFGVSIPALGSAGGGSVGGGVGGGGGSTW